MELYLTLCLVPVLIYILCMDFTLYVSLQMFPTLGERRSSWQYEDIDVFSPFEPLTVKLLVLSPPLHYIDIPLAEYAVDNSGIFDLVVPNIMSVVGVAFGLAAALLLVSNSWKVRVLGVFLFKIRDFMDEVGRAVARKQANDIKMIPNPGTDDYVVNGICAGLSYMFIVVALGVHLLRTSLTSTGYQWLRKVADDAQQSSSIKEKLSTRQNLSWAKIQWCLPMTWTMFCVGLHIDISSSAWNYFTFHYSILFDTDGIANSAAQQVVQNELMKSNSTWMVFYMWRLFNPSSIVQCILLSVLYNKVYEFVSFTKYLGFLILFILTIISYFHLAYMLFLILDQ